MEDVKEYPADKLTEVYIKVRDKRDELKASYEEEDAKLKEQLDLISGRMLDLCKEHGMDSIRTTAGTIMRGVQSRYWTNDWDSMYNFIKQHDALGLFEKRLNQGNMKQFLEENPDVFPPGMLVDSAYKITVRRSK